MADQVATWNPSGSMRWSDTVMAQSGPGSRMSYTSAGAGAGFSTGQQLQFAGAGLEAAGSLFAAYAQYKAGRESLDRARNNAALLRTEADAALLKGEENAQEIGRQVHGVVGAQRAGYAGQGVRVDTGSAAIAAEQSLAAAGADVQKVRIEARKQAERNIRQAQLMEDEGESAYKAARLNAAGTILSGLGKAASSIATAGAA